jgi:23S rRNA pseudouridine1911/1915/1917 synthase
MTVHPGNGNYTDTLVNSLLYSHKDKLSTINSVIRPGIVHRIDKDTTGILVVAKNDISHKVLSEQFKEHTIKREYIALVKGIVKDDYISINKPIGRSIKDRKKMSVTDKNSKDAITHITVLKRFYNSKITLIKANLETGRTHQIRVHMKYLGYPLLGDLTYGSESKQFKVKGHLLHAKILGFIHPTKNEYIEFDSSLPDEFQNILNILENKEKN